MAYHTDLTRPGRTRSGRSRRRHRVALEGPDRRRRTNWTPETVDTTTNTLYFGTGRLARLLPVASAGLGPARGLADRARSHDREDQVVAAAARLQRVGLRRLAAADGLHGQDRRQERAVVSVATMEGVWFAYNATTGAPIYQRVKILDNVEHPDLSPGQAGRHLPLVARRLQLLPRLLRPADELRLQRGRRDRLGAGAADAGRGADPAVAPRQHVPRARERRFRLVPPVGLERLRLGQRRRRRHRQAGLEVRHACSPSAAA